MSWHSGPTSSPDLGRMLVESPRGRSQRRLRQKGGLERWTVLDSAPGLPRLYLSSESLNDFLGLCSHLTMVELDWMISKAVLV